VSVSNRVRNLPVSAIRTLSEESAPRDVVALNAGDPNFNTPIHIIDAVARRLKEGCSHYTPSNGVQELREEIAAKLRRENGVDYTPEDIVVANGGTGALSLAYLSLLEDGDEVLIPDPGWPNYIPGIIASGGRPIGYPTPKEMGFLPDFERLESLITQRTKLLVVNTPNNPTGAVYPKEVLERFVDIANRHSLLLVSDEVYERVVFDRAHTSLASLPGAFERTVTVNSFSKTYAMTGWRVGYIAAPEWIAKAAKKINSALNSCPSSVAQEGALAALRGPQEEVQRMMSEYRERRDFFVNAMRRLPGVSVRRPDGAFYAFVDFSALIPSSQEAARELSLRAGVLGVPGVAFGSQGEGFVRFSLASSMPELVEAAHRIESWARSRPVKNLE
jgi:aspartate aminotransferase